MIEMIELLLKVFGAYAVIVLGVAVVGLILEALMNFAAGDKPDDRPGDRRR